MQKIAFNDLGAQYQHLKQEIDAGIADVISGCHFISGPQTEQLEKELCEYTGRRYCVSVANGTDALLMPLMALGIGKGDAVFVPAFTFVATSEVVSLVGATPIFCDVCRDTFNLDPDSLRAQVQRVIREGRLRPRMVIPVDLFGLPANYPEIEAICREYHLTILEDAAQGFGGQINGKKACSFGDISATSFFPAKPLGCYGDGGAIFTDDEEMYKLLVSIRVHGKGSFKYDNVRVGLNSRLDTLQAAILLPKLHAFDTENATRNRAAAMYTELLGSKFDTPTVPDGYLSSWAQYTIKADSPEHRDRILAGMKEQGIPTMVYYPKPLHFQQVYADLGYKPGDLPVSEALAQQVFSLPMHGYLTEDIIRTVCEALLKL
ncbi:MAG TPA: DegT/DnrJ/EryC1/StrS family aminotransferase [Candidatus Gallacutalibacter pullicola]|uniref:DegT/DnrJ/EryC1/StrS family aminotransferase n=1 Tax=Candidatus Gallacutalibacter pullicola TaxID=2840830 RepID=A0A9D1DR88_9FIRM|nr:DegT/DnrJ/EryC1/StrS family aminotransferase [Candidatus Gallacutalibacter pullicola]